MALEFHCDLVGGDRISAPRETRKHTGIDVECRPLSHVRCGVAGLVTEHGYCHDDDHSWRFVQVTDWNGMRHRFNYVEPVVRIGEVVTPGAPIGVAQDATRRFPGQELLPFVRYEVLTEPGEFLDPVQVVV